VRAKLAASGGNRQAAFFAAQKDAKAAKTLAAEAAEKQKVAAMGEEQREAYLAEKEQQATHAARQAKHLQRMAKKAGGGKRVNPLKGGRGRGRGRKKRTVTKL
jgi:siroheme synthase